MEQVSNRSAEQVMHSGACRFDTRLANPVEVDDDFILQELFGIRSSEHQVRRALANAKGMADEALYAQVAELNLRVARFEEMLDRSEPAKPKPAAKALRSRAS